MTEARKALDIGGIEEFLAAAQAFLVRLDEADAVMAAIRLQQAIDEIAELASAQGANT